MTKEEEITAKYTELIQAATDEAFTTARAENRKPTRKEEVSVLAAKLRLERKRNLEIVDLKK